MATKAARPDTGSSSDVTAWLWPPAPSTFRLYDKYSDTESIVTPGERVWTVEKGGATNYLYFAVDERERRLQQSILIHTQEAASPSHFVNFGNRLAANWELSKRMLGSDPDEIRRFWDEEMLDPGRAQLGKAILKLACSCSVGPWSVTHLGIVEGLPTRSRNSFRLQSAAIKKRDKLVSVDVQAEITRVLDEANAYDLRETHAEGLTALALMYQHAMRPIQLLALRTEHLKFTRDASDQLVCVISFHSAKQRSELSTFEIPRQMKHEWVHIIECLYNHAIAAGRTRLFCVTSSGELWTRIRRVLLIFAGNDFDFNALTLRHTGAQSLADAGHDRESIRNFLGHKNITSAGAYVMASRAQGDLVNRALGTSKLYSNILAFAEREFVSVAEMLAASEEKQVGGIVGDRLVAGIGLCRSGQPHCPFNPVTSCYGCSKFIPSLDAQAHKEAIDGMRSQVVTFLSSGKGDTSPAALQLTQALAGAQQALAVIGGEGSQS